MDEFEQQLFSGGDFVKNPEQKCPVILLLDTSFHAIRMSFLIDCFN